MPIKNIKELFEEITNKGYEPLRENQVSGEEFEKWLIDQRVNFAIKKSNEKHKYVMKKLADS